MSEAEGGARGLSQGDWTTIGPFLAATQPFIVTTNRSQFAAQAATDLRDLRSDPAVAEPVVITAERLPQSWLSWPWTVERVGGASAHAVADDNVRLQLVAEVDKLALSAGRDGWLPLRAAAVARDGHAVVLAGGHRTGKTSLASRLVRAGWEYVADAVTFLDLEGLDVQPYWRPFTLAPDESGSSERMSGVPDVIPASVLGRLAGPVALGTIVIPRSVDDPGPVARVEPAAAFGPMTAHLPYVPDGRAVFHRLAEVLSTVPSWTMSFMDDNAVGDVADLEVRTR